ncbi:MAG: LuxR C-terminal-related transcriptional regulator [Actinomycetes bacterium]
MPRPRLSAVLSEGTGRLLTVVTGPAGAGKTISVASWAADSDHTGPIVWLNCGGVDGPPAFWNDLRQLLVRAGPGVGRDAAPGDRVTAARALSDELARLPEPCVAVLDDFHLVGEREIFDGLDDLLQRTHGNLRLVLVSRTDPELALHRYRLAGELTELRAADLVLRRDETALLLAQHGVRLSDQRLDTLLARAEGWAAGVRLAALSLQAHPDPASFTEAFAQTDQAVSDYLFQEVFARVPRAVRDFLLRTSVVDELHPGLARALAGDGTGVDLQLIERTNTFLQRGPDGSYRYHSLFSTAAKAQLQHDAPGLEADLNARAARWYADHDALPQAVHHGAIAGEWEWVAGLVVGSVAVPGLLVGDPDHLLSDLRQLPSSEWARPDSLLLTSALASVDERDTTAALTLHRAESLQSAPDNSTLPALVTASVLRLVAARRLGLVDEGLAEAEDLRTSAAGLPPAVQAARPELFGFLLAHRGTFELWRGWFDEAAATLSAGARVLDDWPTSRHLRDDCLGQLALLHAIRGHLVQADAVGRQVTVGPAGAGASGLTLEAELALAWCHIERAEVASARRRLDRVRDALREHPNPMMDVAHCVAEVRLLGLTGDLQAALEVFSSRHRQGAPTAWLDNQLVIAGAEALASFGEPHQALATVARHAEKSSIEAAVLTARVRLALGDLRGARSALASALPRIVDAPVGVRVDAWLLEAHLAFDEGRVERMHVLLERALRAGAAEDLRRPFGRAGPWLRRAIRLDTDLLRSWRAFVAPSLADSPIPEPRHEPSPVSGPSPLPEPLTDREQEVLTLLAEFLSTEEIAGALFLSVNTVKTHLKSLYRKLGAGRRVDAVRTGRDLGLC